MMYFINWRRSRSKADDPEEDGEANPPAGKDRDTNLDINAAFNGSRLTQSALTTQLVKSGSQGPRIQPLLYGSIEEKSTSGSYLEKNEYFRGESDPDLARQNNASSTQVIAPAPATVNASTYDSSTAYQEAQIYLAPAQVPASISTLVPVGHAETSRQAPAQGIEPTSEPVTAPRDLPPCRRSLSRPHHAPSTGHPVSVGDGKIAISQSESENSTGALGSLAEIPMDASTEVSKDVYPAHLFRPEGERPSFIENSMPLASVHASGVARLRQLESDKPWLTSLEGEQDSRHSRGNSQIIEEYMLSPAEGIDAVEAQRQPESDTAGSDLSFFTLPETAPLSPIKF